MLTAELKETKTYSDLVFHYTNNVQIVGNVILPSNKLYALRSNTKLTEYMLINAKLNMQNILMFSMLILFGGNGFVNNAYECA
jgi:hypothetical protein